MMLTSTGMLSEDGEFYISSSARPFQFPGGNSDVLSSGSQFFPGQLYHMSSKCKPADIAADFVTPDSGIIDVPLTDKLSVLETGLDSYDDEVDTSPSSMSRFIVSLNDHQLSSHSSDRIKEGVWEDEVDCGKYGVDETSVSQGKVSVESVKLPELPFADILELAKTSDPTNTVMSTTVTNEIILGARPVSTFVGADKDCEPTPQSPSSPLSPSGLGELRHTRDRLKLDLPVSSTAFVLEPPALGKRRSVETVKGEASLLDSGEETEDSGIESSNGVVTSLTQEVKSLTEDTRQT